MKKTIFFLLIGILCAAFFTGCPHETQSEQDQEAEHIKVIFDKETFDAQRKAWESSGIKNYQYEQEYCTSQGKLIYRVNVIKDGKVDSETYFIVAYGYSGSGEIDPSFLIQTEDPSKENYLSPEEYEKMISSNMKSIDDIYYNIEKWYEESQKKYVVVDEICEYEIEIQYDRKYPVPEVFAVIYRDRSGTKLSREYLKLDGWRSGAFGFMVLDD